MHTRVYHIYRGLGGEIYLGSGSVYPFAFASFTASENGCPGPKLLKIKDRVPLKTPSKVVILSPVHRRECTVDKTGRPAPTLAWSQENVQHVRITDYSGPLDHVVLSVCMQTAILRRSAHFTMIGTCLSSAVF